MIRRSFIAAVAAVATLPFQAQAQVALASNVKGFVHGPVSDLVLYRNVTKE